MSPEQLKSTRNVDARADIWALGAILYEAVSGRLPFGGASITELAVKVAVDPPDPLEGDPAFVAVVMRCLDKQPGQRFQTVGELAASLAPLASETGQASAALVAKVSGAQVAVAPPAPSSRVATAQPTTLGTAAGQTAGATAARPRRVWLALAGVALVGGAAAATLFAVGSGGGKPPPADAGVARVSIDAAVLVALPQDAAPGPDADDHVAVRAKLRELATAREWDAILRVADLDTGDPELAGIVADARRHYVAQQARAIEGENAAGRCARSRELAGSAAQLVPDDTTLAAKAKACKGHVEPPADPAADLKAAQTAYQHADFAKALELAERVLAKQPGSEDALKVAALSACDAGNTDKAKQYYRQLNGPDRNFALYACKKVGVTPTPEPEGSAAPTVRDQILEAEHALKDGQLAHAAELAEKILQTAPRNIAAHVILGTIACRQHDAKRANDQLRQLPKKKTEGLRAACERNGITLD